MKKIAKYLSLFIIIISLFTLFAVHGFAEETEEQSISIDKLGTFYYTVENNEITITRFVAYFTVANATIEIPETFEGATVTKIGDKAFYNSKWSVKKVVLPDTITCVGDYAFYDTDIEVNVPANLEYAGKWSFADTKLITTELPNTLTTIGAMAFYNCDSIVNLNFSESLTRIENSAFYDCDSIEEVVIPDGVEYIGSAFEECSSLKTVVIPDMSNGFINSEVFRNCKSLESVTIGNLDHVTVGRYAFAGCTSLESFTFNKLDDCELSDNLFAGCTSLKSVTFTEFDNSTFDENFFKDCTSLKTVNLSDVVNLTIPANMFQNCTALESINFGAINGLTISDNGFKGLTALKGINYTSLKNVTIGAYAFDGCTSLTDFDFTYVKSIGEYAFSNSGLVSANIPATTTLAAYSFSGCPNLQTAVINGEAPENLFTGSTALKEATLAVSKTIPNSVFYNCTGLETVNIPKATRVGVKSFYNCKALKTFDFSKIEILDTYAFYGCSSLDNIDLINFSDNYKHISSYAFYGCTSLKNIGNCRPSHVDDYAFYGCKSLENFDFSNTYRIEEYAFAKSGLTSIELPYCDVYSHAFSECNNLKELYIKKNMGFGDFVFSSCKGLESIIIGDDVEVIEQLNSNGYYFSGCNNVKYFYIGKSFKDTVLNTEAYCIFDFKLHKLGGLEAFEVSPENPYFFTDDGVLYMNTNCGGYDLTVLVSYPAGKTDTFYSTENALKDNDRLFTIGKYAFCENQNLKELEFTKTVTGYLIDEDGDEVIPWFALQRSFEDAVIEKITFTGDNHFEVIDYLMFYGSGIKEIDLDGVIEIGSSAFSHCKNLESVSSDTCQYICDYAFENCENLKSANFPNCIEIYEMAFECCRSLAEINIENVEYIDYGVFYECESLPATLELKKVTDIGARAFAYCKNITTVILPECTYIGSYAFMNTNLTDITLKGGIINDYAFYECTTLKSYKSDYAKVYTYAFYGCTNLETFESNSSFFDKYAMYGCINLENFTPGSVSSVGEKAFYNCSKIKDFNCESVKSIGNYAFYGCELLEILNLTSTTSIGSNAFENCTNLKLVQLAQDTCKFGTNCFKNCPDVSFYCEEATDPYNYAIANNIPVCAVTISFQKDAYEYTGSEIEPSIIVSISGMTLVQNKDYVLVFEDNIERGNGRLIVQFIGNFEGLPDAVRLFSITKADITISQIEYVVDNEYSGEEVKPKVVVKYGDKVFVEGTDYTIIYNSGTDAGSMFFTIKGKGNYTGSIDCYYNIIRRDITEATVSKNNDMVYTGEELTPKPVITWNGFTLVEGVDYEIRYFENVNSGYGTMVIYGMGNFCGTQRIQFRIFGKSLENAELSVIPDQTYTGNEIAPEITVVLNGVTLEKDVDYTVKYENNIEKGTATVVISGIGNYSGVAKQTFNINKNSVYSFTVFSETEMTETYDGTELKPEMEVYFGTELLTEGVDYAISLENNINAGTATVTIIGIGLYEGERSYNFIILPCEITEQDITVGGNMEYNGVAVEPEITISKNGITLVEGEDYILTYSNNNGVGIAFVTIEGKGNYCETINLQYKIYSSQPEDEDVVDKSYTGLRKVDGVWHYIKNGEFDDTYTGLCKYNSKWYYVNKGVVDKSYTGLCKYNSKYYYVKSGVKTSFNGLVKYDGKWYYVKSGVVDKSYTGLVKHTDGKYYYVKSGVKTSFNGLVKYNSKWYYVKSGVVNTSYTGLVKHTDGKYYYVKSGVKTSFNGLVKYNGKWYYVKSGVVNTSYTGLVKHTDGKYYYVKSGVKTSYTGTVTYNGKKYKVKNGVKV